MAHDNPVDVSDVTDDERAMMLLDYLIIFRNEFGQIPKLMPLKDSGKEPVISGNCRLDTEQGESYLVDGLEAVQRIRDDGDTGFAIYAGKESHNTQNAVFIDHDDIDNFPVPTGKPTLQVISGSGRGFHETYRNAGDVQNARVGDGWGEIRAKNWYVATPGSIHPSDGVYHIIDDREIATLSDIDLDDSMRPSTSAEAATRSTSRTAELPSIEYNPVDDPSTTAETVADHEGWINQYLKYGSDDRSKKDYAVCKKMAEYGVPESQVHDLLSSSSQTKVYQRNRDYWERTWSNAVAEAESEGIINSKSIKDSDAIVEVRDLLDSEAVADGDRPNVAKFRVENVARVLDEIGPANTSTILDHPSVTMDRSTVKRARRALEDMGVIEKVGSGTAIRYKLKISS